MSHSFFDTIKFWQVSVLICSVLAVTLGVLGVSGAGSWAAHYAAVQIPPFWYLFAVVPPAFIALAALIRPRLLFGAPTSWRCTLVVCITLLFGGTEPLIYIVYNLDKRSHEFLDSTRSLQHR